MSNLTDLEVLNLHGNELDGQAGRRMNYCGKEEVAKVIAAFCKHP